MTPSTTSRRPATASQQSRFPRWPVCLRDSTSYRTRWDEPTMRRHLDGATRDRSTRFRATQSARSRCPTHAVSTNCISATVRAFSGGEKRAANCNAPENARHSSDSSSTSSVGPASRAPRTGAPARPRPSPRMSQHRPLRGPQAAPVSTCPRGAHHDDHRRRLSTRRSPPPARPSTRTPPTGRRSRSPRRPLRDRPPHRERDSQGPRSPGRHRLPPPRRPPLARQQDRPGRHGRRRQRRRLHRRHEGVARGRRPQGPHHPRPGGRDRRRRQPR